ncbi:MAG TPA: hypothetical protein EYQ73_02755 [Candidatus Poseidoniales archaeon]|jgi:3-oxoacyl-(acyl-carrier-protein) synthase|nr:MAG: hypothetical protein CXT71_04385 [Euryarchaeota archaeon]HIF45701.1 hypothetical protein [Candidatus Poseidoniales archaeon]HIL65501.1 hypothetical protein [Candidatus Poseidoniales archaeon]
MGTATWMTIRIIGGPQDFALGIAVLVAFFSDSVIQSNVRKQLKQRARRLQTELNLASSRINQIGNILNRTDENLRQALVELERRDSIGSPAARKLLSTQKEAIKAQKKAIEMSGTRSIETLESLERMIISQGSQTARMQEVLTAVLEKLALEPRQSINMRDSVLMQEAQDSCPSMSEDVIAMLG